MTGLEVNTREDELRVLLFEPIDEGCICGLTTLLLGLFIALLSLLEVVFGRIVKISKVRWTI